MGTKVLVITNTVLYKLTVLSEVVPCTNKISYQTEEDCPSNPEWVYQNLKTDMLVHEIRVMVVYLLGPPVF